MTIYNGINHLAMATCDMDRTIRFWRDLLGMRLVAGLGRPGYRHYFFEISEHDLIAFFEWPDVKRIPEKDHGVPVQEAFAFDHLSIGVASENDLWELKQKLDTAGFWVSEVIDHGFIFSIYSFDPNNIPIEFSFSVPDVNIRNNPRLADTDPSPTALEGPEPNEDAWPDPAEPLPMDERAVYPGEGKVLVEKNYTKW